VDMWCHLGVTHTYTKTHTHIHIYIYIHMHAFTVRHVVENMPIPIRPRFPQHVEISKNNIETDSILYDTVGAWIMETSGTLKYLEESWCFKHMRKKCVSTLV